MVWYDNRGHDGTVLSDSQSPAAEGKFREQPYVTIRRMIVVKEGKGFCWCMSVTLPSISGAAHDG